MSCSHIERERWPSSSGTDDKRQGLFYGTRHDQHLRIDDNIIYTHCTRGFSRVDTKYYNVGFIRASYAARTCFIKP
jgi:hypothetical protein